MARQKIANPIAAASFQTQPQLPVLHIGFEHMTTRLRGRASEHLGIAGTKGVARQQHGLIGLVCARGGGFYCARWGGTAYGTWTDKHDCGKYRKDGAET